MNRVIFLFLLFFLIKIRVNSQCNQGLNLGAVIVPTHGNSANGGNFMNVSAWQEAANWLDSFNLDYRQRYLTWTDVVQQISGGVPTYNNYQGFENLLTTWSGNCNVHVIYPVIKVELPNVLLPAPTGFISAVSNTNPTYFSDTSFINQNYLAIKHILQNVNNVKWISIGNEIDTYFKGSYWGTGRLTRYSAFLDTVRNRMNIDGFTNVKIGTIVAFHNLTWSGNYDIIDSIRQHVDFVGYTFYYTTLGPPYDTCWASPANVTSWLNVAKAKVGTKKMMLTETSMGDGGGISQNCGSPTKQLAYVDTLLNWYNNDTSKIVGMTWFTITDPYLGWQTPSTLWNTCGLVDSNGITIQSAGINWRHNCMTTNNSSISNNNLSIQIYPNPFSSQTTLCFNKNLPNATLAIHNLLGQKVAEIENISGERVTINRNNLPNGMYFIRIIQENQIIATEKMIITE